MKPEELLDSLENDQDSGDQNDGADNSNNNTEDSQDNSTGGDDTEEVDVSTLMQTIKDLTARNQNLTDMYLGVVNGQQNGNQQQRQVQQPVKKEPTKFVAPQFDLSSIPEESRDIVKFMMENAIPKVAEPLLAKIDELEGKLEQTQTTSKTTKAQQDVQAAAAKHKDFWNFRDQMIQLSDLYPDMPIEHVYFMAKGATSISARPLSAQQQKQGGKQPGSVGTEKPTGNPPTKQVRAKSMREALELAYKENEGLKKHLQRDI